MKGAISDIGEEHWAFHKHLDDWMDEFRGSIKPTVRQYNQQMEKALVKAGLTAREAKLLKQAAEKQQRAYGINPSDVFDVIPQRNTAAN